MKLYYHDQLVVVVVQIEVLHDQHVSFESQITHKQQISLDEIRRQDHVAIGP
jgi:hypothetical protein